MIGPTTRVIMESTSANAEALAVCTANPMDADLGRGYIKTPLGSTQQDFVHYGKKNRASPFGD
jgi:hypothetical protein